MVPPHLSPLNPCRHHLSPAGFHIVMKGDGSLSLRSAVAMGESFLLSGLGFLTCTMGKLD